MTRKSIRTFEAAIEHAAPRPATTGSQIDKKNYAQRLSEALAELVANALRADFRGILPSEDGRGRESRARTSKGFKKLDVNYSTVELGLGLGVSIKTLNFPDPKTSRFTKNYSRNDGELRAEASDYHKRQPYSVLVGILFLPVESCDDSGRGQEAESGISSFGRAVQYFRARSGRRGPIDDIELFEAFFIGVYELGQSGQTVRFFDVMTAPPRSRRPAAAETISFEELIHRIKLTYDQRNAPPFSWAE